MEGTFTATGSLSINQMPGTGPAPAYVGLVVGDSTHASALSLGGGQMDNGNAGNAWVDGNVSSAARMPSSTISAMWGPSEAISSWTARGLT